MRAICPKSTQHKEFYTTAHVLQDWKVDENGTFLSEVGTIDVVHGPESGNYWECAVCGAQAQVV